MRGDGPEARIVAVVGPSGSGKSSVVRAGLLPALVAGRRLGSERWFLATMVPGADPFEGFERALTRIAPSTATGWRGVAGAATDGLGRAVAQALPKDGELALVIDQFEELFTLCTDEELRRRFVAGLVAAALDPDSRLRLVLTLRADFFDRPLRHAELAPFFGGGCVTVPPLRPEELEQAIVEPARQVGVGFEAGLIDRIVGDVVDQPGALPLLQYTLTELFGLQVDGLMTNDAYGAIGGLSGALARRAEEIVTAMPEPQRQVARRVFTRLVSLGEGTDDTRRRVRITELGGTPATSAAIAAFSEARLLTFDRDPETREPTVEVAHEALLRVWTRLRHWLDDDRDGLRLHRHLTAAATAWATRSGDLGELYRGGRLEGAESWADAHPDELNAAEWSFLEASVAERDRLIAVEVRSHRRLRRSLVGVALVAVLALIAGGAAWEQSRNARTAQRQAVAERATATEAAAASAGGDSCCRQRADRRLRPRSGGEQHCCGAPARCGDHPARWVDDVARSDARCARRS